MWTNVLRDRLKALPPDWGKSVKLKLESLNLNFINFTMDVSSSSIHHYSGLGNNGINGVGGSILESITNFTNALASPIMNDNDNEEEDALNVKEPLLSTKSSPILNEQFMPINPKSSQVFIDPNTTIPPQISIHEPVEHSSDKVIAETFPKETRIILERICISIDKIQKDIHKINFALLMPPWYSRFYMFCKKLPNFLVVKVSTGQIFKFT